MTLTLARRRLNLALSVLALVLALLLAVSLETDRRRSVSGLEPAEIREITVTRLGEPPYTLKRLPGGWYLSAPGVAAVARHAQNDLVAAGAALSKGEHRLSELDEAAVGLSEPRAVLRLNDTINLEFGDRAALSGLRYVHVGEHIHLVDDRHYHSVNQALEGIVAGHLLPDGSEMVSLTIGPWRLYWSNGEWLLDGALADQSAEALARGWSGAEASVVGKLNPKAPSGEPVRITLAVPERTLEFELIRSPQSDGLFLARRDLGVAYHFPPERAPTVPTPTSP